MKRSSEIEKLIRDAVAAYERGDVAFVERTTSKQLGVVSIGTDANEYVLDYEPIISSARDEMGSSPHMRVRIGQVRASHHGDVGGAVRNGYFAFNGQPVEVRNTCVFLRAAVEWRG